MRTTADLTRARRLGNASATAKRPIKGYQIVRRCCAGAVLCKSHGRAGVSYTLQPPGTKVKTRYARAAINSGALTPLHDGLFADQTQTWVVTPPTAQRCPCANSINGAARTFEPLAHGSSPRSRSSALRRNTTMVDVRKYFSASFVTLKDVADGPIRGTIADVAEGKFGKLDISFEEGIKLSLNATNGHELSRAYGTDTDDWLGHEIELYAGEVEYQGKPQAGVRVKPISLKKLPPKPAAKKPRNNDDMSGDDIPF
jgi:hypothetical protein